MAEGDANVTTARLPADTASVGESRHLVRRSCAGIRRDVVETAELLPSELVTNAIVHGGSPVALTITRSPIMLRISVADSGPGDPLLSGTSAEVERGRGLAIVQDLSHSWGVAQQSGGKAVWFALTLFEP